MSRLLTGLFQVVVPPSVLYVTSYMVYILRQDQPRSFQWGLIWCTVLVVILVGIRQAAPITRGDPLALATRADVRSALTVIELQIFVCFLLLATALALVANAARLDDEMKELREQREE